MAKKLYHVKVVLYVMAENTSEACVAATRAPFDIFECTARKADHVDQSWENAIPYNADDESTCSEILANEAALRLSPSVVTTHVRQASALRQSVSSAAYSSPG